MAHTRQSCFDTGYHAGSIGSRSNPFKPDSWQANAWADGNRAGHLAREGEKAEAGQGQKASDAVAPAFNPYKAKLDAFCPPLRAEKPKAQALPANADDELLHKLGVVMKAFPENMPEPTREHCRRLTVAAYGTRDSTKALRYTNKVDALYERHA